MAEEINLRRWENIGSAATKIKAPIKLPELRSRTVVKAPQRNPLDNKLEPELIPPKREYTEKKEIKRKVNLDADFGNYRDYISNKF